LLADSTAQRPITMSTSESGNNAQNTDQGNLYHLNNDDDDDDEIVIITKIKVII
jgi:hypothetical protein